MNPIISKLISPDKETPTALPDVEESLRAAARKLQRQLGSRAGGEFRVRPTKIRIKPLRIFMEDNRPKEPSIFTMFGNGSSRQPGLILMPGKLLSRLTGCMLGETGDAGLFFRAKHPITDLEMRFGRRICLDLLSGLSSHWPDPNGSQFQIEQMAPHGRFITPDLRSDPAVGTMLKISANGSELGKTLLTVPLPENLPSMGAQQKNGATMGEQDLRRRALELPLELVAELARVSLPLGRVRDLSVGDTIPLGPAATAVLRVQDRAILEGEPGNSNGYHSLRVTEKLV